MGKTHNDECVCCVSPFSQIPVELAAMNGVLVQPQRRQLPQIVCGLDGLVQNKLSP